MPIEQCSSLESALEENKRLRKSVEDWHDIAVRSQREIDRLRAEVEALRKLADDLYLIMPGQPGHGDISREQRTKADYMKLRGEVGK